MRNEHHVVMSKGECCKYKSVNITKYIHECGKDSSISRMFMIHPINLKYSSDVP